MNPNIDYRFQASELDDIRVDLMERKAANDSDTEKPAEAKAQTAKEILEDLKDLDGALKKRRDIDALIQKAETLFEDYQKGSRNTNLKAMYKIGEIQRLYAVLFESKEDHVKTLFMLPKNSASMPVIAEGCTLCARDFAAECHRRFRFAVDENMKEYQQRKQRDQELRRAIR